MKGIQLKAEQVEGLTWQVIEETEDYRRSRAVWGKHPDGTPVYVLRTEVLSAKELLEANARQRNENDGKRWGDDKNGIQMSKIGSVPLNILYRDFQGRLDDQDFKKWWWSRTENAPFRTRRGNL